MLDLSGSMAFLILVAILSSSSSFRLSLSNSNCGLSFVVVLGFEVVGVLVFFVCRVFFGYSSSCSLGSESLSLSIVSVSC